MTRAARSVTGRDGNGRRRGGMTGWNEEKIARGLGLFGIGLGLAEIAAPRGLAKLIGIRGDYSDLLRLLGIRKVASGIGILAERRPAGPRAGPLAAWMWSRVGGGAMDLALLGAALKSGKARQGKVVAAAVAGVTALDLVCSLQLSRRNGAARRNGFIRVAQAITINRSPEELYRFWRDSQNLPRFMKHLESVQVRGEKRSHWVAKAPAGM